MDSQGNCVGRRTRGQFQKRLDEFSLERKQQRQKDKAQQQPADSGKSQRNQESRKRKAQDCTYHDGDETSYHDLEVGKRNQESKKKREGQDCTYDDGDQRSCHDLEVGKRNQESKKKREGQDCTYDDGDQRSCHDLEVGKRNQESKKKREGQDCTYDDGDQRSCHDLEVGKRNQESKKKREGQDCTYDDGDQRSCHDLEVGKRNQESKKKREGQDCTYDDGDQRSCHDLEVGKRNQESKKKRKGQDCTYDDGDQRSYHDLEVGKRNQQSKKKRKGQDCTYDDGDQRSYHDLEVGKRNQESRKERKGQDCTYEDGDKRSHPDLEVGKRNQQSRKKASSHLSVSSSSSSEAYKSDSNDADYKEEQSITSDSLSSSSKDDHEVEEVQGDEKMSPVKIYLSDEGEEYLEREEGRSVDNGFKKKVLGLHFWRDVNNRDDNGGGASVRKWPARLRQRSVTKSKKMMLESGSVCNPVCVDDSDSFSGDESSSKDKTLEDDSSSHDDSKKRAQRRSSSFKPTRTKKQKPRETSSPCDVPTKEKQKPRETSSPCDVPTKKKHEFEKVNDSHCVSEREESDSSSEADSEDSGPVIKKGEKSRQIEKPCKSKGRAPKDFNFMNILADSIWEEGDPLGEKLHPLKENAPVESTLQRKFRLQNEDPVPEKDESEKETDRLFADLQMGLIEMEIGYTNVRTEGDDGVDVTGMTIAERCELGYHQPILFEHIGMVCKYCKTVLKEIHNMFPEMKNRSRERSERVEFSKMKRSTFKGFEFDESGCENHHTDTNRTGSVLNLIPVAMRRSMYLHQRDGFEFLWKNMSGETLIENLKTTLQPGGTGCIISHAPGTGKSFLTIVFIMTFMNFYPNCRPVIVAPRSMLLTWAAEFRKWGIHIPFHNLNDGDLSGQENVMATSFLQQLGTDKRARDYIRMVKLYSWTKERSVLGVGYQLFEKLANHKTPILREKFRKILLEMPGLVVLDEGHTPRNDQSLMWKHLTKIETRRRIILSGTPFQNNFDELHNILTLVNPGFDKQLVLNSGRDDRKVRGRKSRKGKSIAWDSLANSIDRHSPIAVEKKLKSTIDPIAVEKIKSMIDPFVHVHKGSILQEHLLGVRDTLIVLRPSNEQLHLLKKIEGAADKLEYLEKCCLTSLVAVHPSVSSHKLFEDSKDRLEKLKYKADAGVKTKFLFEVIRLSIAQGEKVLVFSQFIDPLKFISNLLRSYFSWGEGKEVLVMHGGKDIKDRQSVINCFNDDKSESKVLLASIKACCEGINLVGASRVILLDVVWNPSVERQAICRAYRIGQKKVVHVYRLIMSETLEIERYKRQVKKDRLSDLVFSSKEGEIHKPDASSRVLDDKILDAIVHHANMRDIFEQILPQPKEANLFEDC